MSKSAIITIIISVTVFIGGLVLLTSQNKSDPVDMDSYDVNSIIAPDDNNGNIGDHVRGSRDAKVFVIEYFDFSCPMCAQVEPIIEEYIEQQAGSVAFITRNYPVTSSHPNSVAAASAAEAAGLIKKPESLLSEPEMIERIESGLVDDTYFYEMTATLLKNQTVWYTVSADKRTDVIADLFSRIAPEVDKSEFVSLMGGTAVKAKIDFDLSLVKKHGVSATPSFYLDGTKLAINNIGSIETVLKPAVEAKLSSGE